jgi:hypothetical protein
LRGLGNPVEEPLDHIDRSVVRHPTRVAPVFVEEALDPLHHESPHLGVELPQADDDRRRARLAQDGGGAATPGNSQHP